MESNKEKSRKFTIYLNSNCHKSTSRYPHIHRGEIFPCTCLFMSERCSLFSFVFCFCFHECKIDTKNDLQLSKRVQTKTNESSPNMMVDVVYEFSNITRVYNMECSKLRMSFDRSKTRILFDGSVRILVAFNVKRKMSDL